jgi:2-haloacid dehalogenase
MLGFVGMQPDSIRALVFDVFGSVVDWRGSIVRDLGAWGAGRGLRVDWAAFADAWRARYQPQMERVRSGALPWTKLDDLHAESLRELLPAYGVPTLGATDFDHVLKVWHRLDPWPDSNPGLARLKRRFLIAPLSNGNIALLANMAKHAGLPWDHVFSAETFRHYKPQPEAYLGVPAQLDLRPSQVMMCAAHNGDLEAARAAGLSTAFWPRPIEHGPGQRTDLAAEGPWDIVARDIEDLATQLGC